MNIRSYSRYALLNEDGRDRATGVAIGNLSIDPDGRIHTMTRGRVRRWWQTRRGWTHYVGSHFFE